MADHVAIIGGGFSGTMAAVQLLRAGVPRVTLIERRPVAGLGLAFGAADPSHLLNVRAGNMSAYPDDPGHFARWLEARGVADAAASFAPRTVFGAYLREQLDAAVAAYGDRLRIVHGDAVGLDLSPGGATVALAGGARVAADNVVLAFGNLPPPAGIDPAGLPPGAWIGDPWASDVVAGLDPDDTVLVIGTGLTMIDIVLLLERRGFTGPIVALSRRGLIPHAHADGAASDDKRTHAPAALDAALVREVRARGAAIGWRHAVDELRPFTQDMWRTAAPDRKRRLMRHLRPWWDIHRHRIAPAVRAGIDAMIARGQLRVAAGRIVAAAPAGDGALVRWRPRGSDTATETHVRRIINCTGPEGDLPRSAEPLLRDLLAKGLARPGPGGLGIDVDADMRVLGADGAPQPRLRAVGPPTRGYLWEIVAVPDIRAQVRDVAAALA